MTEFINAILILIFIIVFGFLLNGANKEVINDPDIGVIPFMFIMIVDVAYVIGIIAFIWWIGI